MVYVETEKSVRWERVWRQTPEDLLMYQMCVAKEKRNGPRVISRFLAWANGWVVVPFTEIRKSGEDSVCKGRTIWDLLSYRCFLGISSSCYWRPTQILFSGCCTRHPFAESTKLSYEGSIPPADTREVMCLPSPGTPPPDQTKIRPRPDIIWHHMVFSPALQKCNWKMKIVDI